MDQNKGYLNYILLIFIFLFTHTPEGLAGEPGLFRIGTGGKTGMYYPLGKLIAQGLTGANPEKDGSDLKVEGIPGLIGVAQNSAGSIENINALISGDIHAGFIQANDASHAFHSSGPFLGKDNFKNIRALASLYPEMLHIITRKDAGIRTFIDLKGKRISLDEIGSGTLSVMQIVLKAHDMAEKDLAPVYLKPMFIENQIMNGELQGFAIMGGAPMEAVTNHLNTGIFLVPVQKKMAEKIHQNHPYLVPGIIPGDAYPDIPETHTIQVYALLAVRKDMDEALAYQVTASLWSRETKILLDQVHPKGKNIRIDNALAGLSIPLHEGAIRFYKEKGLLTKEIKP
jgi:TRAP transporter TAXI family solute receptor